MNDTILTRSPQLRSSTDAISIGSTTIYKFAIIVEPVAAQEKERHCLTAYFKESPFPFEIDEWAQALTGNDYRVADSFLLEEISL